MIVAVKLVSYFYVLLLLVLPLMVYKLLSSSKLMVLGWEPLRCWIVLIPLMMSMPAWLVIGMAVILLISTWEPLNLVFLIPFVLLLEMPLLPKLITPAPIVLI